MAVQIQWRRDTAANWTAANPTLAQGEAGLETDTGKIKLGDGATAWNSLAYFTGGLGMVNALSAGTQSASSGTVVFSNSNGISFGMSGSSRVTASYTVPSTAGLISAINVSAGTTSNNLSAITFGDGGNVSFGLNGSVVTASAPSGGGAALSAGTQSANTGTIVFANSNSITFGMSGSSQITASFSESTHSHATAAYSGSNGSFTANTVTFGALNGLTFYTSNGSMVGSYTVPAAQTNVAFSADASSTFQTLTFQNSNGVSFSNNAGAVRVTHDLQYTSATSAITSNALNTSASRVINIVAATNNTGGGTASLSSNVSFSAANGLTFYTSAGNAIVGSYTVPTQTNQSAIKGLGVSNTGQTAGNTGLSTGIDWVLAGSQSITLSQSTAGGGPNTIWFQHPAWITTARASNDAIGLNTAQTNVTWTVNSSGLSLNAAGYAGTGTSVTGAASITLDSLGLKFNGSSLAGVGTTFAGANISGSMTMNTAGLNLSMSVAAPGAAAEQNAINLLGANTAGNTTATGSTIGMSGLGGITLSGTNGSQVVFSVGQQVSAYAVSNTVSSSSGTVDMRSMSFRGMGIASVGISNGSIIVSAQEPVLSRWSFAPEGASSAGSAMTQGSMSFQRLFIPEDVSFSRVDLPALISIASSATANTGNLLISSGCVIYSVSGTSTLNPIAGQFATTTYTHASNTANWNSITGPRYLSFNIATLLGAGEYYVGFQLSTNNNSSIGTATTADPVTISIQHGAIYTASQWAEFGVVTATSLNMRPFVGVGASVTATNQTVNMNAITQTGTALMRANVPVIFRNY